MNTIEKNILKRELWRRAARHFAKAELYNECAAAWIAAGDEGRAIDALIKAGDRTQAARLLLKAKRYQEAASQAQLWLQEIAQEPQRKIEEQVSALLNLAAALHFDQQLELARTSYARAREKLAQITAQSHPLTNGRNWEALAQYGVIMQRPDLIRLGYEKALISYGRTLNLQRLRCAGEYLEKVTDDLYLSKDLKERMAEWQPQSNLKRERERLWQALANFSEEV